MTPIPIIKLEVSHMKHTLGVALSQYTAQLDETLQDAIDAYCTPENLERVIQEETTKLLNSIIKEEVKRWFVYGEGRKAIRAAVEERLRNDSTYTPLDFEGNGNS